MTQEENDLGSTVRSFLSETLTFNTTYDTVGNENAIENVEQQFDIVSQIDDEGNNLHDAFNANDGKKCYSSRRQTVKI